MRESKPKSISVVDQLKKRKLLNVNKNFYQSYLMKEEKSTFEYRVRNRVPIKGYDDPLVFVPDPEIKLKI